jgi:hypothetical protein
MISINVQHTTNNQKVLWKSLDLVGTEINTRSPAVTLCMTSLTLKNPTFCPHSVHLCFKWMSEEMTIISPYEFH